MQRIDNVIQFKKQLTRNHNKLYRTPLNSRRENRKGALKMSKPSSAIRVIKTSHGHNASKGKAGQHRATRSKHHQEQQNQQMENRRTARFRELAMKRVPRVLHALRLIENLASHNYKYTPDQVEKILRTIEEAVLRMKDAFARPKKEPRDTSFNI